MRKIVFITGTRADYGKLKPLMKAVEQEKGMQCYIYVSGMHLLEKYGSTYGEIEKDGYKNIYLALGQYESKSMSYNLGNIVCNFTGYIANIKPDMIIVHGDRIDALAGAMVGAINNIRVAHIEGGEISGTIDESIRHAISKFSHIHFVSNTYAKKRIIQMGELEKSIFVIGSPDIDIMLSNELPDMKEVRNYYNISFDKYLIFMYHPVTTEYQTIGEKINEVLDAIKKTKKNYVVIYPNNDMGSEIIIHEIRKQLIGRMYKIFPSIRFEYFLTLLKNSQGIIGNSSAGIRESGVYGIPAIDIGNRQKGRYNLEKCNNIQWVEEKSDDVINAILRCEKYKRHALVFGEGNSTEKFMNILNMEETWNIDIQKHFVDR